MKLFPYGISEVKGALAFNIFMHLDLSSPLIKLIDTFDQYFWAI
jgi:hypothetical protein